LVIPCAKKMFKQVLTDYKSYLQDYTKMKKLKA